MGDLPDLSSDDELYDEDEWMEMENTPTNVKCLFCNNVQPSVEQCLAHCEKVHNFDLAALKGTFKMDCYSYIKMINFIKINKPPPEYFSDVKEILWDDEKYLKPVDNDAWSMFDFDSLLVKPSSPSSYHANVENGLVTLSQAHFIELQRTIQSLTEQLRQNEVHLQMARDDITKMQYSMKRLVEGGHAKEHVVIYDGTKVNGKNNVSINAPSMEAVPDLPDISPTKPREIVSEAHSPVSIIRDRLSSSKARHSVSVANSITYIDKDSVTVVKEPTTNCDTSLFISNPPTTTPNCSQEIANTDLQEKEEIKIINPIGPVETRVNDNGNGEVNCVANVCLEDDEGYFNTYSHFGIHHDMLSDKVRTESYKEAILGNEDVFRRKTVLDLGCGTGILSMFAAAAGAKKVYAIDQSEIIYHAMDIVRENNLDDVIKLIKGRLENTQQLEKVDIIVSEWMGYFLLFEGMLDSVIYARDNLLNPGGILLPNKCTISLVANSDEETHKRLIDFWSDVYGYKMNCMKTEVVREANVDIVGANHIVSDPCVVQVIDINTCDINAMDFKSPFKLTITRDCKLSSLVGYFDTFFDLPNQVSFSTGPHATPTHWKQTVFYFRDCKEVKAGDVIEGTITCKRRRSDVRALAVQINVFGKNHRYILN